MSAVKLFSFPSRYPNWNFASKNQNVILEYLPRDSFER